jgi:hypothetical protein
MKLKLTVEKGIQVIVISEEISAKDAGIIRAGISKLFKNGKNRVMIEISDSHLIPDEVIRDLSSLDILARELSGRIVLVSPNAEIRSKVENFVIPPLFLTYPDRASGFAFFEHLDDVEDQWAQELEKAKGLEKEKTAEKAKEREDVKERKRQTRRAQGLSDEAADAAGPTASKKKLASAPVTPPAPSEAPSIPVQSADGKAPGVVVPDSSAASPRNSPAPPAASPPVPTPSAPPVGTPPAVGTVTVASSAVVPAPLGKVSVSSPSAAGSYSKEDVYRGESGELGRVRKELAELKKENELLHRQVFDLFIERRNAADHKGYEAKISALEEELEKLLLAATNKPGSNPPATKS